MSGTTGIDRWLAFVFTLILSMCQTNKMWRFAQSSS